ncbi:MAG TPA: class I SAM-dependent methyltransferase [Wenzhouxiangella sp.]|nr:class I SAM-dependent methyltransferase [Wenzhouxiangella sp.]
MSGSDSRLAGLRGMQNRPRWRTMNPNLNLERPMRFFVAVIFCALVPWAAAADPGDSEKAQDALTAAVADPQRADDRGADERRQLEAVVRFAEIKPGNAVIELSPGGGYWTRVFSRLVGENGHVYTIWPEEMAKYSAESMAKWRELADSDYSNVEILAQPAAELFVPAPADVIFTSQNYHDYYNLDMDTAAFAASLFDALKPGGALVIIDHAAPEGTGADATDTLHRIEGAAVKSEMEAAGFEFDAESDALRNADDPLDVGVFDESVRGRTDQFIYRFRKPTEG